MISTLSNATRIALYQCSLFFRGGTRRDNTRRTRLFENVQFMSYDRIRVHAKAALTRSVFTDSILDTDNIIDRVMQIYWYLHSQYGIKILNIEKKMIENRISSSQYLFTDDVAVLRYWYRSYGWMVNGSSFTNQVYWRLKRMVMCVKILLATLRRSTNTICSRYNWD